MVLKNAPYFFCVFKIFDFIIVDRLPNNVIFLKHRVCDSELQNQAGFSFKRGLID